MIPLWTEGICGDGAAILCDGIMVPIEKVIESLNHCEALNTPDPQKWKCGALPGMSGAGENTPTECNWPLCNCDPYADKVIAALQECGVMGNDTPDPRDAMQFKAMQVLGMTWGEVIENYRAPNWCDAGQGALEGGAGCWSLVGRSIRCEADCGDCPERQTLDREP